MEAFAGGASGRWACRTRLSMILSRLVRGVRSSSSSSDVVLSTSVVAEGTRGVVGAASLAAARRAFRLAYLSIRTRHSAGGGGIFLSYSVAEVSETSPVFSGSGRDVPISLVPVATFLSFATGFGVLTLG